MIAMPDRIARLPQDSRGYPIPWNVLRGTDGKAIFTVNDQEKHVRAIREQLCPICGERLGRWRWFTGGIRSAFDPHGAYYDLPGHHECEQYALQVCPYLALPRYLGRIDVPDISKVPRDLDLVDITMIKDRPEVFVSVASSKAEVTMHGFTPVLTPDRPYSAHEFWRAGKQITTEEAMPFLLQKMGAEWTLPRIRLL
jgi:hypothetical protein